MDEYVIQTHGESLFFTRDRKTVYRVPIILGVNPENGNRRLWIDPNREYEAMWPKWETAEDGPYVLYKADKAYYECLGTIDAN